MTSEKDRPISRISYKRPTAVDLGAAAPVVGGSCVTGQDFDEGDCDSHGNVATFGCIVIGNSAGFECSDFGNSAVDHCNDGNYPVGECIGGDSIQM